MVRKPNGSYLARVWEPQRGKLVNKAFPSEAEARDWIEAYEAEKGVRAEARRLAEVYTLGKALGEEQAERVRSELGVAQEPREVSNAHRTVSQVAHSLITEPNNALRDTTRGFYVRVIERYIDGTHLGRMPVRAVRSDHCRAWWGEVLAIAGEGGTGAQKNALKLARQAFKRAVDDGLIPRDPLKDSRVKGPRESHRQREMVVLEADEVRALADAGASAGWNGERDRLVILLLGFSGLRAGEVGGLRVEDVDLVKCRVSIRGAVRGEGRGAVLGPTKTESSRRTIQIHPDVCEALRAYIGSHEPAPDGRIFWTRQRSTLSNTAVNRIVHSAAQRAGIRRGNVHSHQLRHTCASLLYREGLNVKAISRYLGHANAQITLNLYTHLFDSAEDETREALGRVWQR